MSPVKASLSAFLLGFLALGCSEGSSSQVGEAMSSSRPAIHFLAEEEEVTSTFLPEEVRVTLSGLAPAAAVTLRASMPGYASHATFRADETGAVDVASQAPEEGTYQGADASGLFWSMAPTGGRASLGDQVDVDFSAEVEGEVVATATLRRDATDPGIVETPVRENGLYGVLVTPSTPGPHPALLTWGGSEGGIEWGRQAARLYASLGYTCLGLAYFRAPGLPKRLDDVPIEYFGKAISWIKKRPEAKPDALGVMGVSRGGELALLIGATFPEVKAVVAQVPSGVIWPGEASWSESTVGAWTLGGHELSYVPPTDALPSYRKDAQGHRVEYDTPMFEKMLDAASGKALAAATTPVEKVRGPVLLLASGDDQIWPSCRLASIAMDRLRKSGHAGTFEDDFVCYPEAGHITGTPGLPTTDVSVMTTSSHEWIAIGGTPAGIARAARAGYERKRAFLAKALK